MGEKKKRTFVVKIGRPEVHRPCPKCGEPFPARLLRFHRSWCRGRRTAPLFQAQPVR
jgi:hypothetical protein